MSGPSLKKIDAHSSIHEAAMNEAKELQTILQKCLEDKDKDRTIKAAEIIIEHWESRTLAHAEAEEDGLYKELVNENADLQQVVTQLTRDHDLMRRIVEQMKSLLMKAEIDEKMISLLDCLIIIDSIHNDDEMYKLLGGNK